MSHLDEHPEPDEGCQECVNTPHPRPQPTAEELLSQSRLDFSMAAPRDPYSPERPEYDAGEGLRRIARAYAEYWRDLQAIRGMQPEDFE